MARPKVSELTQAQLETRRAKERQRMREYRKVNNPELKQRYGITKEQRDELLSAQGGVCAICSSPEATDVDHCHSTKAVRGILFRQCNTALGLFKDNTDSLAKAIEYLTNSRAGGCTQASA